MATGQDVKKLLLKLGFNTADWKSMLKEITSVVDQAYAKEQDRQNKAIAKLKEQFTEIQAKNKLQQTLNNELTKQTSEYTKQLNSQKLQQEQAKTRLLNEKAVTEELRRQTTEKKKTSGGSGGGEGGGDESESLMQLLGVHARAGMQSLASSAGGGLFGTIFAGALTGNVAAAGVIALVDGLKDLTQEIIHVVEASGELSQVEGAFESLSSNAGINAGKFKEDLQDATRGLVKDLPLMQSANKILQQNTNLTEEQIVKLFASLSDLARAQGKPIQDVFDAVNRSILTGNFRFLAMRAGLDGATTASLRLTSQLGYQEKITKSVETITDGANRKLEQMGGAPATNITEAFTKINNSTERWFESLEKGITTSGSFEVVMDTLDQVLKLFGSDSDGVTKAFAAFISGIAALIAAPVDVALHVINSVHERLEALYELGIKYGVFMQRIEITGTGDKVDAPIDPAIALKIEKENLTKRKAMIEAAYQTAHDGYEKEQADLDQMLKDHLVSLQDYADKKNAITQNEGVAQKTKAKALFNVELANPDLEDEDARIAAIKKQTMAIKYNSELEKINEDTKKKIRETNQKFYDDEAAAEQASLTEEVKMATHQHDMDLDAAEERFKNGQISVQQVLDFRRQRVLLAQKEAEDLAKITYDAGQDAPHAAETLNDALINAEQEKQKKIHDINVSANEVIFQDLKNRHDKADQLIVEKTKEPGEDNNKNLQARIDGTQKYLDVLMHSQFATQKGTTLWEEQHKEIEAITGELLNMNLELEKGAKTQAFTLSIWKDLFDRFDKTKGVGAQFGHASDIFSAIGSYSTGAGKSQRGGASQNIFEGLGVSLKNIFKPGANEIEDTATERVMKFAQILKSATDVVGSFIQALTQAQGATSGAVGGGLATVGLGQSLKGIKGLGFLGGPMGSAIELGVGAILGGIFGHSRAIMETEADKMALAFKNIGQSISEGSVSITEGLKQLQSTRAQTVSDLSGKKGGRAKLKTMLPDFDDQIHQLQVQQQKADLAMTQEMGVLSSPTAVQSQITSIESLIDKYKAYALTVSDVSQAYQYLSLSLAQYVQQQNVELSSADEQAIQDAIQLNDLLIQRTKLLSDEAQQEQDIMTQGVLVRTRTSAQTKLDQITQLRVTRDEQLEQLNEQITLTQFKVDAEKQLFDLTGTRVALESRLVALQETVISSDMARIAALKDVITQLQSGNVASLLPAGYTALPSDFLAMFQQFARMGYSGFTGT